MVFATTQPQYCFIFSGNVLDDNYLKENHCPLPEAWLVRKNQWIQTKICNVLDEQLEVLFLPTLLLKNNHTQHEEPLCSCLIGFM